MDKEIPIQCFYHKKKTVTFSKKDCSKKHLRRMGATGKTHKDLIKSLKLGRVWDCGKRKWVLSVDN
jgi:hypothetical protein